jgi:hypothetical protein
MVNGDLDDVYCTVQHNEFTEVQGDHRDPLLVTEINAGCKRHSLAAVGRHPTKANPQAARADCILNRPRRYSQLTINN